MTLIVDQGDVVATTTRHVGHGCQVAIGGLYWAMDQRFRLAFPAMYKDWQKHARAGAIRPGDHLRTLLPNGAVVRTLGIKQGMNDPVDLAAVTGSLAKALATTDAQAITFHRIGTRCQGRLPWSAIASAIGPIAASSPTHVVILTDE